MAIEEMSFSEILRELIEESGLSQRTFAKKAGFTEGQASEWLHGRSKPGYDSLKHLCKNLNIPAERLLGLDAEKITGTEK